MQKAFILKQDITSLFDIYDEILVKICLLLMKMQHFHQLFEIFEIFEKRYILNTNQLQSNVFSWSEAGWSVIDSDINAIGYFFPP